MSVNALTAKEQTYLITTKKQRYKVDLAAQHSVAELNYARILRLLGQNIDQDNYTFQMDVGRQTQQIKISIIERCPYTTMIDLFTSSHKDRVIGESAANKVQLGDFCTVPSFSIRLYHDVKLAEVVSCEAIKRLQARYEYPNKAMLLPDEKQQVNILLGEWLAQLLNDAYASESFV